MRLPNEWHGGTLAPGTPHPSREPLSFACRKEDCEAFEETVEVMGLTDLGCWDAFNPDDECCAECGDLMTEPAWAPR